MMLCRYETNLSSVKFSWNSVDSVLMPKCIVTLPEMCTATCGYKKKCIGTCQCSKRRILHLSLPIDSVGHCMRYGNIKLFSEPNIAVYEQKPRIYTGKYVSEKTGIFAYFTQCILPVYLVFHLLAHKITHH